MIRKRAAWLLFLPVLLLALPVAGSADTVREKEPGPKAKGQILEWKTKDGLVYQYFVPKDYDEEKGANLTLILHGSNLDRRWGFANHRAGDFRPDDVVVCPDGTTPNGQGGFNFLGKRPDAERVHDLIEELKKVFQV